MSVLNLVSLLPIIALNNLRNFIRVFVNPKLKNNRVVLLVFPNDNYKKVLEVNFRSRFFISDGVFENKIVFEGNSMKKMEPGFYCCLGHKNYDYLIDLLDLSNSSLANIDYTENHLDGWEWHNIANQIWLKSGGLYGNGKDDFLDSVAEIKKQNYKKSYIFGTGPSLSKVVDKKWNDGYRVVCNTIVRDKKAWNYIKPHIVVAADTIYHFGHTRFAKRFREDLRDRLLETNTIFVYPSLFQWIVEREFSEFKSRLFPMSIGSIKKINVDFSKNYELPNLGNILPLMLLPIASFLSKNVYLWGFDGKAPKDKLFWKNSTNHTYEELMITLQKAHPAFFEYYVPKDDSSKYIKAVQGDELDMLMTKAEDEGWRYVMMHHSWTPTLEKRFK